MVWFSVRWRSTGHVCVRVCVHACVLAWRGMVLLYVYIDLYMRVCVHAYVWACLCTYTQFKIEN